MCYKLLSSSRVSDKGQRREFRKGRISIQKLENPSKHASLDEKSRTKDGKMNAIGYVSERIRERVYTKLHNERSTNRKAGQSD